MKHEHLFLGDIHKIHNWEVDSMTAREQLVVVGLDVGKICWQKDDDSFWFLKQHSPVVWAQLGVGNAAPGIPTDTILEIIQVGTVGVDGHMHYAVITTQMIKDIISNFDSINAPTSADFTVTTNDADGHMHTIGINYSFVAEGQGNKFTINSISGNDTDNHFASFVGHAAGTGGGGGGSGDVTKAELAAGITTAISSTGGGIWERGSGGIWSYGGGIYDMNGGGIFANGVGPGGGEPGTGAGIHANAGGGIYSNGGGGIYNRADEEGGGSPIESETGFIATRGSTYLADRDPIEPLEVATKQYVDANSGGGGGDGVLTAQDLANGIDSDIITYATLRATDVRASSFVVDDGSTYVAGRDPSEPLEVATKQYADTKGTTKFQIGKLSDGHTHIVTVSEEQILMLTMYPGNSVAVSSNPSAMESDGHTHTIYVTYDAENGVLAGQPYDTGDMEHHNGVITLLGGPVTVEALKATQGFKIIQVGIASAGGETHIHTAVITPEDIRNCLQGMSNNGSNSGYIYVTTNVVNGHSHEVGVVFSTWIETKDEDDGNGGTIQTKTLRSSFAFDGVGDNDTDQHMVAFVDSPPPPESTGGGGGTTIVGGMAFAGTLTPQQTQTAANGIYFVSNIDGGTIWLPVNPADGDRVELIDIQQLATFAPMAVKSNEAGIETDGPEGTHLDMPGFSVRFIWSEAANQWLMR